MGFQCRSAIAIAISKARPGNHRHHHRDGYRALHKPGLLHSAKLHYVKIRESKNFIRRSLTLEHKRKTKKARHRRAF
jgi:hypothetical protein